MSEPVTAICGAITQLGKIATQLFSGENRKLMADAKRLKRYEKYENYVEDLFVITDRWANNQSPEAQDVRQYFKLKKKCDKYD